MTSRLQPPRPFLSLVASIMAFLLIATSASAQQQVPTATDLLIMNFHDDPNPERLKGLMELSESERIPANVYPLVAGVLTTIALKDPAAIERLVPDKVSPKAANAIIAALRMSGDRPIPAALQDRLSKAGTDRWLSAEFSNLPSRLDNLVIRTPTHLDILWGASFATADPKYVRMIIEYFAASANQSEPVALDIARTAMAMATTGSAKGIFDQLKAKYGNGAWQIIVAAAALWGLQSNAKQHAFVDREVVSYLAAHPGAYASKALSIFRAKR